MVKLLLFKDTVSTISMGLDNSVICRWL